MTAETIVDSLLEARLPSYDVPGMEGASEFFRDYVSRKEAGKKFSAPGNLAAYTNDWPEFDHWTAYNKNFKEGEEGRAAWKEFYHNPEVWHEAGLEGVVYYSGRPIRIKGIPGSFRWTAEWRRSSSTNWQPGVMVTLEHWDRDRIWKSHWKQQIFYDYKKDVPGVQRKHPLKKEEWDAAHPDYFDTKELDHKIKDRLVGQAQKFLEKLSQVAEISKVRWHVPELFQEARNKPSTKGFEQIGGDFGSAWEYGGTWFNKTTGEIVHFDGMDGLGIVDIESSDKRVDDKLTLEQHKEILDAVSLESPNEWENVEDEIRQKVADNVQASTKYIVYRTSVEDNDVIEQDWAEEVAAIKKENQVSDEDWAKWSPSSKMAELAARLGWDEFDHYPEKYTRSELSEYLGLDL